MYPKKLKEQYNFLLKNLDFFKTFGKYTEPYENKIIANIVEKYKDKPIREKLRAVFEINKNFKPLKNVPVEHIYSVKEMEDKKIVGACSEYALLTSAIMRKLGFPTAMVHGINIRDLFQPDGKMHDHVVNIVYDGNKWWLIDSTKNIISRFIAIKMYESGYIIANIFRDFEDLGISDRREMFYLGLENVREYLLLDLQEDIVEDHVLKALNIPD